VIAFRAFSKHYGDLRAVISLTFEVAAGEVVALLGPNGSSKTTSIKAAAGLVTPSSGIVGVGAPAKPSTDPAARRSCSFLPQRVAFPETLTAAEILEFHRRLRGSSPARTREVAALTGLEPALSRRVGGFSGGMTQRLGLAVALLPDSPILLLDEPTAALDPDGIRAFYGAIEAGRRDGRTVLFSSHQMGDLERLADRFVVLAGGRLVASLTAAEINAKLADRGRLAIALERCPASLVESVRRIAPAAAVAGRQLVVPAPTAARLAVLDAVRSSGAVI